MDHQTTNQLDRLLASDGMSGAEADAIFERVMAGVERDERKRIWPRALWAAGALSAAAAIALFAFAPVTSPPPAFTARGAAGEVAPRLEVICSGASLAACPISSKLIFVVAGDATSGFLSAYAEPLTPGAERVWYFSKHVHSPELAEPADGTRVFERAVRIAGSHRPGRYRIHVFLASRALGEQEMLANPSATAAASLQVDIQIVGE